MSVRTCCRWNYLLITRSDSGYRVLGREKLRLYSPSLSDRWFILYHGLHGTVVASYTNTQMCTRHAQHPYTKLFHSQLCSPADLIKFWRSTNVTRGRIIIHITTVELLTLLYDCWFSIHNCKISTFITFIIITAMTKSFSSDRNFVIWFLNFSAHVSWREI